MISLFPLAERVFAAIEPLVNEFAGLVIRFVELIVTALFW
jgi:hypothetical protein